jgi:hypothetical protein
MSGVRNSPDVTLRAITCDGQLVGSIASFVSGNQTEVTYWIGRPAWGCGIASLRVLQKAGFSIIGTENSYAPGRNRDIEETILRLD